MIESARPLFGGSRAVSIPSSATGPTSSLPKFIYTPCIYVYTRVRVCNGISVCILYGSVAVHRVTTVISGKRPNKGRFTRWRWSADVCASLVSPDAAQRLGRSALLPERQPPPPLLSSPLTGNDCVAPKTFWSFADNNSNKDDETSIIIVTDALYPTVKTC